MDGVARREALITQWSHPLSCRFPLANIKWSSDTSGESPNALTPWSSGRPVRSQVQPCEWHIARALSRRRIITRLVDKLRQWKIKRQLNGKQLYIGKERDFEREREVFWTKLFFKFVSNFRTIWNLFKIPKSYTFFFYTIGASRKVGFLLAWLISISLLTISVDKYECWHNNHTWYTMPIGSVFP